MIEIERGIPIPEMRGAGRGPKYPFRDMEVGDSFYTDCHAVVAAASQYVRRYAPEKQFATRKEGSGRRVWRVS